ncbi:hypothetical protein [Exiguobacterium marinum]|uniref:hypothetical protein n=1 Tax=Exiguobacterium marinum TaxID=273528 RepID=UPI000AC72B66|nr:hypothetical protein [Exiguobacterium marinum]
MYRAHPEIIIITFLQFCGVERLKKSKPTKKDEPDRKMRFGSSTACRHDDEHKNVWSF